MKNILIVDDDIELRQIIAEVLTGAGYHVDVAASGKEAVEKVPSGKYDIALIDMMMPGMSGTELLIEVRKMSPKTRAIMITAFATVENAVAAIKKGASDYISKPFKINELLVTVRRVLEEASFEISLKKLDIENTLNSLSNPIRRNILQFLNLRPDMHLMELTRELDIEDHTKVVFHLKTLKEARIIRQDKGKSYSLTKEGAKTIELLRIIEDHLLKT